jgi:hypothetical protein
MRPIPTLVTLGALLTSGAEAQSILTVRVYSYLELSDNTLSNAEGKARNIFHRAGIKAEWIRCPTERQEEDRYPGCRKPREPWDVILHLVPRSMERQSVGPEAFGFALPATGGEPSTHAYVFVHRAERTAMDSHRSSRPVSITTLVAYVMVHEIGHVILGPNMHSSRGMMRPRWQPEDLYEMEIGGLGFPPDQARSLRLKLNERTGGRNPPDR